MRLWTRSRYGTEVLLRFLTTRLYVSVLSFLPLFPLPFHSRSDADGLDDDKQFINSVCTELWVCGEQKVEKFYGDVDQYKNIIVNNVNAKNMRPTAAAPPKE